MRVASQRALELPSTQLGHPFGPDWDVLTVRGRVFLLITEVTGHPQAICKAHPDDSLALRQAHADVVPGYHMNKRHWISLLGDDDEAVGRGGDPDAGGVPMTAGRPRPAWTRSWSGSSSPSPISS